jgi:hypothetical protein
MSVKAGQAQVSGHTFYACARRIGDQEAAGQGAAFTDRARASGLLPSMIRSVTITTAMIESFWGRVQTDLLNWQRWKTLTPVMKPPSLRAVCPLLTFLSIRRMQKAR